MRRTKVSVPHEQNNRFHVFSSDWIWIESGKMSKLPLTETASSLAHSLLPRCAEPLTLCDFRAISQLRLKADQF